MGVISQMLTSRFPVNDVEVLDGYRRYEASLSASLTLAQLQLYADFLQQCEEMRVLEEMQPEELGALSEGMAAMVAVIVADSNLSLENRRVATLLRESGCPARPATPAPITHELLAAFCGDPLVQLFAAPPTCVFHTSA